MNAGLEGVLGTAAAPLLLIVKATLLLAAAYVATVLLRGRSAAVRHLTWTSTMAMLLVLPLAALVLPGVGVPIVSRSAVAAMAPAGRAEVQLMGDEAAGAAARLPGAPPSAAARPRAEPASDRSEAASDRRALLAVAWAAGALAVLGWLALGRAALYRVRRRAQPVTDAAWRAAVRDACWVLDVDRPVRLYRSRAASVPMTWGVLRSIVLLPEVAETWGEDRRRVVLLHELAHVARHDCLTQLIAVLACAVWWFHPGVWHAARRMRVEREHACDERVLAAGTSAPEYASHLLALAQQFRATVGVPLVALHMARPSQLEGRLLSLLAGAHGNPPTRGTAAAIAAAMLLVTLPLSALQPTVRGQGMVASADLEEITAALDDALAVQDSTLEYTLPTRAGERLLLDLRTGGDVEIVSWEENSVRVRAVLAGPDWRESELALERSADGVNVVAWQRGSRATYSTSHRFRISVPRNYDVELRSQGGDVAITGVSGTFRGHTAGGSIVLSRLNGTAELTTGGGSVRVSDSHVAGRITTGAGDVTLRNVSGGLRGSSGSGRVTAEAPRRAAGERTASSTAASSTGSRGGSTVTVDGDSVASIRPRIPLRDAAYAITTRDGMVALMLLDTSIVLQYTDRGLEELGRTDPEKDEAKDFLATLVSGMLRGGLRALLDRAIEYSLHDLHEARYERGRLVLESRRGNDVFGDTNINGGPVMEQFSERDARAFAQRVNAVRSRLRR